MSQRNKIVASNTPAKYAPLLITQFLLKSDLKERLTSIDKDAKNISFIRIRSAIERRNSVQYSTGMNKSIKAAKAEFVWNNNY